MAYQNVGTPTFYIDSFVLYNALKLGSSDLPIFDLNPSSQYLSVGSGSIDHPHQFIYNITTPMYNIHYIAVLGHNLGNNKHLWQQFRIVDENGDMASVEFDFQGSPDSEVNYGSSSEGITYDGFSIRTFTDAGGNTGSVDEIRFYGNSVEYDIKIGCISMGSIYEMKNAPNLSLKMSREYGGTKEFTTYNGSSMSNTMGNINPAWGELGAWELGDSNPALSCSGRRTWDLTFSYIDDGNIWGSNQSLSTYINTTTHIESDDFSPAVFTAPLEGQGNMENHTSYGYNTFSSGSNDSFTATHVGGSTSHRASTSLSGSVQGDLNVAAGESYLIEFDLTITSGEGPFFNLSDNLLNLVGLSGSSQQAVAGHNSYIFTTNYSDTTALILFYHLSIRPDSEFTVSNLTINVASGNADGGFNYNLLTDDNFFSQVWHKTLGGNLPFIFQPDSNNFNPDQFAICRLKENSLKATQSAFGVYDISLQIEEVW